MSDADSAFSAFHSHVFLGDSHERSEKKTWAVIWLCTAMMIAEIAGGWMFGSVALVADGVHMSTHAGALLLAALAYTYARRHADDPRFTFGTGKFGDLAGFASAIILAAIALLIAVESIQRLWDPAPIHFAEAIPIAVLGLAVNIASAWLLSGGDHHGHSHGSSHGHAHGHDHDHDEHDDHDDHDDHDEHEHHAHGKMARDNNFRAAVTHVVADAAVSVLVIIALLLARAFGWLWLDPVAGIVGAVVIASWALTLIRDTGAILLDMNPDDHICEHLREVIEQDGDRLADLHLWRLGPGHLGAILSVVTPTGRTESFYREKLGAFKALSHLTIEVRAPDQSQPATH
jgi:cation diffusion facilitator family transporter